MVIRNNNGGLDDIINPNTGRPVKPQPRLIVIKRPVDMRLNPQIVATVGKATGCIVLEMPMDSEMLTGRVAKEYIEAIHMSIHQALGIPPAN